MAKNVLKIIALFIVGVIGGIFADQILWPYFIERPLFYQYSLEQNPVYLTEVKEITVLENTAITETVEKVEKSVVGVKTETAAGKILEGSGLIVTSDGLMVTLAELVPQGSDFEFLIENKKLSFQILKRDSKTNLALIKLADDNLSTVSFADLDKLKLGERVFLVGITFDAKNNPQTNVNEGIVKSLTTDFIKTNISENYLLAGSPLFNVAGEALGINTIDSEGKVITIPISKIKEFIGL